MEKAEVSKTVNKTARAAPPPRKEYHRTRKLTHLICFLVFTALPFFNVMRFDIPRQRFYFAGYELWINEFGILFFSLMFLMFVVAAASVVYGRMFCSYLCPQMIFSEASIAVQTKIDRLVNRRLISWPPAQRALLRRVLFLAVLAAASVFLAFAFISYFVEPRDLLERLLSFDIRTAGGISGAVVTLITFLDFTLVRQRFCTTVCPYGYLQGMLGDGNTLLVHYRDESKVCIECKKCVRVCHMGIDIRTSPYQIECIHCGECIDACGEVLGRLGKPGLIHYAWGEKGEVMSSRSEPWYRRAGLRDAKRAVVMLVIMFYLCGLFVALSMRRPVLVNVYPERATLYDVAAGGRVVNHFRVKMANRSSAPSKVLLGIEGLPGAALTRAEFDLAAGETAEQAFDVTAVPFPGGDEVNHFRFTVRTLPDNKTDSITMTFLMPPPARSR